nr:unnamed protein product [Callosobruchus chinensis]
MISTKLH